MQKKNRKPIGLEALEDRWVPASVHFDGSNLTVYNLYITGGTSATEVVEQPGTNHFKVIDGHGNQGTYAVTGNITLLGNNAIDALTVNIDGTAVTGVGLTGNLSVSAGNGPDTVTVDSINAVGTIYGNVNISMGDGLDTAFVGDAAAKAGVGMNVRGNTTVRASGTGANAISLGGAAAASTFSGNVSVSDFPTVNLGGAEADVFAGNVSVNNSINSTAATIALSATSKVLGSLTVAGGIGSPTTVSVSGSVLGNLSLDLGNAANSVSLTGTSAVTPTTVGNLYYSAGNGNNTFTVNGTANEVVVTGNVDLNWGNGANSLSANGGLTVEGSYSLNNGNGGLDANTTAFASQVYGNLTVNTGNGVNSFTVSNVAGVGAYIGGTWNYRGGNTSNAVEIDNTGSSSFTMNVYMGTGPDLFTIGAGTTGGTLTGLIDWAVPSTATATNAFVDHNYVWTDAITLINVPS